VPRAAGRAPLQSAPRHGRGAVPVRDVQGVERLAGAATRQTVCTTSFGPGMENSAFAALAASISSARAAFGAVPEQHRPGLRVQRHGVSHASSQRVFYRYVLPISGAPAAASRPESTQLRRG
jgi:hypothetical protein